jgi:hypothetical protein
MAITEQAARREGRGLVRTIAFSLIAVVLLAGGGALFLSDTAAAGYGIWVFVWGLAFLLGALARSEAEAA